MVDPTHLECFFWGHMANLRVAMQSEGPHAWLNPLLSLFLKPLVIYGQRPPCFHSALGFENDVTEFGWPFL